MFTKTQSHVKQIFLDKRSLIELYNVPLLKRTLRYEILVFACVFLVFRQLVNSDLVSSTFNLSDRGCTPKSV